MRRSAVLLLALVAGVCSGSGCGPRLPPLPSSVDPVCGRTVPQVDAAAVRHYRGETFYFHGAACARTFDEDPERYRRGLDDDPDEPSGAPHSRDR